MYRKSILMTIAVLAACLGLTSISLSVADEPVVDARYRTPNLINGIPEGWDLMKHDGTPNLRLVKVGDAYYLNMISDNRSGFGIEKVIRVNLKEYPYLNWTWSAVKLPNGGDVRKSSTDDQVLQIYVVLPATGFPSKLNTPILTYVWDNEAPKGTSVRSSKPFLRKIRYLVVRNKQDKLGQWYREKRNVYEDYKRIFKDVEGGEPRGPTHGLRLYINSQNTKSNAEGYIGEIYFSKS
jgi:hypothetical protein